jgi:hypothetical protein
LSKQRSSKRNSRSWILSLGISPRLSAITEKELKVNTTPRHTLSQAITYASDTLFILSENPLLSSPPPLCPMRKGYGSSWISLGLGYSLFFHVVPHCLKQVCVSFLLLFCLL